MRHDMTMTAITLMLCFSILGGCAALAPMALEVLQPNKAGIEADLTIGQKKQSVETEIGKDESNLIVEAETIHTVSQDRNTEQKAEQIVNNTTSTPPWLLIILIVSVFSGTVGWMVSTTPQDIFRRYFGENRNDIS